MWEALKIIIGDNAENVWDHNIEPLIGLIVVLHIY